MDCPHCHAETKVIDSRVDDQSVRRRRECLGCENRFTTYERIELNLLVTKRDGRKEPYDRRKIVDGIRRSGKNRPVVLEQLDDLVNHIEHKLMQRADSEVASRTIGEYVMEALRQVDAVAYLRFTSVCRSFEDVASFAKELEALGSSPPTPAIHQESP